jgi:predicted MFS family arabinose efflux permease
MWWLLRRYQPGAILLIGVAMGLATGIPFYFLRPFAQRLEIPGIRGFFLVYAGVAFFTRLICRRLPDRWGVRRTVMLGMGFLAADMLSFLLVRDAWTLLVPATLGGVAHAFVFPAAMTGGSLSFPTRYRGLATTLMLTMFDLGNLVGQPAVGSLLTVARQLGWPPYPTMFLSVTVLLLGVLGLYARSPLPSRASGSRSRSRSRSVAVTPRFRPPSAERSVRSAESGSRLKTAPVPADDRPRPSEHLAPGRQAGG